MSKETSPSKRRSTWRRVLSRLVPITFYALLIVFLFFYIRSIDFTQLANAQLIWPYFLISVALGLGFRYWGAYIWFVLLKSLGAKHLEDKVQLIYVYAKSWLGRYIPGTAPWILGKIYFASKQGISKNKLAVSSLLEGALQVVVTLILAFLLLIFDPRLDVLDNAYKWMMAGIVLAGMITLIPAVFNKIIAVAYKLVRRKTFPAEHRADAKTIFKGTALYTVGVLINGLALFFIAKAIYPELPYSDMLFVMGATSMAAAVSMIAVFAPSGIGVREGIQLVLLSIVMPTEFALLITVVSRIKAVGVDFLFYGLAWSHKQLSKRVKYSK